MKAGTTIEIKRDGLFPQSHRWDNLFEGRQNISPSFIMEPGVNIPSDTSISSVVSSVQVQGTEEREMVVLSDYELSDAIDPPECVDPPGVAVTSYEAIPEYRDDMDYADEDH